MCLSNFLTAYPTPDPQATRGHVEGGGGTLWTLASPSKRQKHALTSTLPANLESPLNKHIFGL